MPDLLVRRDDPTRYELGASAPPADRPADGEAHLAVERLALTTNNISYAVLGERLGYWRLFPAPEGWGRLPAWGHARVTASRSPSATEGERVFGMVPVGRHFAVRPIPRPAGWADASPHRAELSPAYNQYLPVGDEDDDALLVMRPLFGTSVLLDLALADAGFDGAGAVVLTSASSKTAFGLAYLLRARPVTTIGLTAPARRDAVVRLGLYDAVLGYDELGKLAAAGGAVLVDFAGDEALTRAVHEQLGAALARSISVGFTHRGAGADGAPPPGPAPEFFFAPDEIVRRGRGLGERFAAAWRGFAPVVEQTLRIERVAGGDALLGAYRTLLAGRADPATAYVVTPE